jgi:microsomal dipeptidase-like Zn-dependent dipeptidase
MDHCAFPLGATQQAQDKQPTVGNRMEKWQMAEVDSLALHHDSFVLLAHVHMARNYTAETIEYDRPDEDIVGRQVDIPKLRQGGVKCIWLSEGAPGEITIDPIAKELGATEPNTRPGIRTVFRGPSEVQRLLRGFDAVRRLCQNYPDDLELATTAAQIRDIASRGKIAVLLHTEALMLANDLAMLRSYYELGLRVTGLVHSAPQDWIDNDREQFEVSGLTDFGRQVIREMNR